MIEKKATVTGQLIIIAISLAIIFFSSCKKKEVENVKPIRTVEFYWYNNSDSLDTPKSTSYLKINQKSIYYPFSGVVYKNTDTISRLSITNVWIYEAQLHQGDTISTHFEVASGTFYLRVFCDNVQRFVFTTNNGTPISVDNFIIP